MQKYKNITITLVNLCICIFKKGLRGITPLKICRYNTKASTLMFVSSKVCISIHTVLMNIQPF